MKAKRSKYYQVAVVCWNCDWSGEVRIPMGTLTGEAICLGCGCCSLAKDKGETEKEKDEEAK